MIWANKTFDPEKAEVLYLFLEINRKTSTLMVDRHRLEPENRENRRFTRSPLVGRGQIKGERGKREMENELRRFFQCLL